MKCANIGDCDDGTDIKPHVFMLWGIKLEFNLCTSCARWLNKFYNEARDSNRPQK